MLKQLIFLIFLSLVDCQFACNAIHTEFKVFSNETNSIAFTGSYDYSVSIVEGHRNQIVIKPLDITYNANSTIYSQLYADIDFNFNDNLVYCNYSAIPGSKCVTFGSSAAFIYVNLYYKNYQGSVVGDKVLIDDGSISMYTGEYIGVKNANNISINANLASPPFSVIYQKSKCTSFLRLPDVDSSLPKCLELIGDTVIYNLTNNKEEMAVINVRYTLDEMMTVTANFKILSKSFLYNQTEFIFDVDDNLYDSRPLNDTQATVTKNFTTDQKVLSSFWINYWYPYMGAMTGRIGKFIYRNGVVLMDENTPFTPDNYCKEYAPTSTFADEGLFISTTMCCGKFSK